MKLSFYLLAGCINGFGQWLYDWQTLAGAVLALLAAGGTIVAIRGQIAQADRHENQRISREHKAVRATLPLTLSGLSQALRQMLKSLDAAKIVVRKQGYTKEFDPPETPDHNIGELQMVISSTDNLSVTEPIAQIIREIQTLWSRVEVLSSKTEQRRRGGLTREINIWILQAAKVHAMIESLFEYARTESDSGPNGVAWERAESILIQLGIEDKDLMDEIGRGLEKDVLLWKLNDRT